MAETVKPGPESGPRPDDDLVFRCCLAVEIVTGVNRIRLLGDGRAKDRWLWLARRLLVQLLCVEFCYNYNAAQEALGYDRKDIAYYFDQTAEWAEPDEDALDQWAHACRVLIESGQRLEALGAPTTWPKHENMYG